MSIQHARDVATVRRRPSWSRQLSTVERTVLLVGVAVLAALALATVLPGGRRFLALATRPAGTLVLACLVYGLGHLLRGLRLAVLINDPAVGARRILAAHVLTSGLGLLLPFKLGDLVRMRLLGVLVKSNARGVVAVVLERSLDVGVVLGISVVATVTTAGAVRLLTPLLVLSGAFVLATIAAVTVVPDYLRSLALYLVSRPNAAGGTRLVVGLERVLVVLDEAPHLLRRRIPTLVVLTALVWLTELATLALAVPVLADDLARLSGALASFLSSLTSGAVALLPGTLERALDDAPGFRGLDRSQLSGYRTALVVPLLWASVAAGVALRGVLLGRMWKRRHTAW